MKAVKPKRKTVRKSVQPKSGPESAVPVLYDSFERVTSSRMRLKRPIARTFYALAYMLAEEHDLAVSNLGKPQTADFRRYVEKMAYHRHASSAFRVMADRLLKSFDLLRLVGSEKYAGEEFEAAVNRMNTNHNASEVGKAETPEMGESWDAS